MLDPENNVSIERVPAGQRAVALGVLHLGDTQIQRMLSDQGHSQYDFEGLFQARRDTQVVGAAWGQRVPGNTAFCWPPVLRPDAPGQTAGRLQTAVDRFLDESGIVLTQAILSNATGGTARRLIDAGYRHLTNLDYMVCTDDHFPRRAPTGPLTWSAIDAERIAQLGGIVERTYHGSLDCPELDGTRSIADVLEGYRGTGHFVPAWWLCVRHFDREIGCLILADHPEHDQVELVYLGVVPEARGQGWGRVLTRHAQWLTARRARRRLILAVDAANWPARNCYASTGFASWDRRSVFVRNRSIGE